MSVRSQILLYNLRRALPLLLILMDIIPVYFFPRAITLPAVAALTAILYILNRRFLHIHCLAVFLLWGAIAASVVAFRYEPQPGRLPETFSKVTALEGTLKSDSRRTKGGNCIYDLEIERVVMQSITQEVKLSATVFARGGKGFWGDSVRFDKVRLSKDGKSFSAGRLTVHGSTNHFFAIRRNVVEAFTAKIQEVYGRKSYLAEALLTGSRDNLDPVLKEQFRRAGVSHVLALSGMHLGIIALFVFFIVRRLAGPRLSLFIVNIVNILYLFLAGISPSLLRAVIMFFLVSLAKMLGYRAHLMRILIFAFSVILMAFPIYFFSLSFQLSFLALAGILLLTNSVSFHLGRMLPQPLADGVSCSISAMIFTAPVTLCTFGVVYPIGIITSLVISPLMALYMCLGLACLHIPSAVLGVLPVLQSVFACLHYIIETMVEWASFVPEITL